jgi:hypothetical protein
MSGAPAFSLALSRHRPRSQEAPERGSGRRATKSGRRRYAAAILLVWGLCLCLSLLVQAHPETSTYELLYYSFYNVAIGALVGFYLFDRLPKDGFALFAALAASAILLGTLANEIFVERFLFGMEPINGIGVYYGLTDSLFWSVIFLLFRLAEQLRDGQRRAVKSDRESGELSFGTKNRAETGFMIVRAADGTRRILARDVLFMAAERDFTRVVCADCEHFVSESLKSLLERSAGLGFIRVHKSFAVNLGRVDRLARMEVQVGDRRVPLGRRYRATFLESWRAL